MKRKNIGMNNNRLLDNIINYLDIRRYELETKDTPVYEHEEWSLNGRIDELSDIMEYLEAMKI